jgi:transglutaminase-like putative cysteine protease
LVSGQGSCPDLYDPGRNLLGLSPGGLNHASVEVFLPGAGWIAFDATNRSMGSANLIPVAVASDITQLMPVSGTFIGPADAFGCRRGPRLHWLTTREQKPETL